MFFNVGIFIKAGEGFPDAEKCISPEVVESNSAFAISAIAPGTAVVIRVCFISIPRKSPTTSKLSSSYSLLLSDTYLVEDQKPATYLTKVNKKFGSIAYASDDGSAETETTTGSSQQQQDVQPTTTTTTNTRSAQNTSSTTATSNSSSSTSQPPSSQTVARPVASNLILPDKRARLEADLIEKAQPKVGVVVLLRLLLGYSRGFCCFVVVVVHYYYCCCFIIIIIIIVVVNYYYCCCCCSLLLLLLFHHHYFCCCFVVVVHHYYYFYCFIIIFVAVVIIVLFHFVYLLPSLLGSLHRHVEDTSRIY
jgi:hypothetical protein